ncbi:Peptidase C14, caspase catalytic subunit p20, partial [Reticulomyxa filosa]
DVKIGSNELLNTILSGSNDSSVRLWDIRSGQQIQVFNKHESFVSSVEYSLFVIKNSVSNSNVICSGSHDNTIRFWDIRSNKNELYKIKGYKENGEITCLKFILLKKKEDTKNIKYDLNLCYGSRNGHIRIWGKIILNLFDLIECKHWMMCFILFCCLKIVNNCVQCFLKNSKV